MRDSYTFDAVAGRPRGAEWPEVALARAELTQERERRARAEATAAVAEERATLAEERAAIAEWLVALLRSELICGEPRHSRHWWQRWFRGRHSRE